MKDETARRLVRGERPRRCRSCLPAAHLNNAISIFAGQTSLCARRHRQTGVNEPTAWLGWSGSRSQTSCYKWLFEMCGELVAMTDLILVRLRDSGNSSIQLDRQER